MAKASEKKGQPSRFDVALEWTMAGLGLAFVIGAVVVVGKGALAPQAAAVVEVRETARRATPQSLVIDVEVANRGDETAAAVEIEATAGGDTAAATIDYVPGRSRREASLSLPPGATGPIQLAAKGWAAP